MKEKDLSVCLLYDVYAPLLSEKKREAFEMYYWDDLSLAEISEHTGTSRQGVRELVARTCEELDEFEKKLGLWRREKEWQTVLQDVVSAIEREYPDEAAKLRHLMKGE